MLMIFMIAIAAFLTMAGFLVLAAIRLDLPERLDIVVESERWHPVNAEVISVLRASDRTFLRVRYSVGTRLIENDVRYPFPGATPAAGRRVPLRYDPAAPARVIYDHRRTPPGPDAHPSEPVRTVSRKPLTRA
jgi:hypothetical protein